MKTRGKRRQSERGVTYVEVLAASLVLAIGLMGIASLWAYADNVANDTDRLGIAYNLGRQALEQIKIAGFTGAAEGTTTAYFDGSQASVSPASAQYTVVTSVVSSSVSSGTPGAAGAVPASGALRTVTVTVQRGNAGSTMYQTRTYLAGHGI